MFFKSANKTKYKVGDVIHYKVANDMVMTDKITYAYKHGHSERDMYFTELGRMMTNRDIISYD